MKVLVDAPPTTSGKFIIPEGVEEIESYSCNDMDITSVRNPNSVQIIGDGAFLRCDIESFIIPASVTEIGDEALAGANVKEINVDPNNQHYSSLNGTLYNKDKTLLIQIPKKETGIYSVYEGVVEIDLRVFSSSAYTEILLPSSLKIIGDSVFSSLHNLSEIILPESLKKIGYFCFSRSPLKQITIPVNVEIIGDGAFESSTPPIINYLNGIITEPSIFKDCTS